MSIFETEFWLPVSLETVWGVFKDPRNLVKISPSYLHMSLQGDVRTAEGAEFDIKMNPFGFAFAVTWRSRIQSVQETPEFCEFQDIQVKGPFKKWCHTHRFESGSELIGTVKMEQPGTWLKDRVEYEVPVDFLKLADHLVFRRVLAQMFAHRKKALRELLVRP